jgi:hypothetical protein
MPREKPSSWLFADKLAIITKNTLESALNDAETNDELSESTLAAARRTGWIALNGNERVAAQKVGVKLLGADQIQIDCVGQTDMANEELDEVYYVAGDLFKDGEPYVPDEDLLIVKEAGLDASFSRYVIFAGPEIFPTAVNREFLTAADAFNPYSINSMSIAKVAFGREVLRPLSDNECDSLVDAVNFSTPAANAGEFSLFFGA